MRPTLLTFVLMFVYGIASAQTLVVRSGDHENFTRFTVGLAPGTSWSIQRSARTLELSVDLPNVEFDTSLAFSRISKGRVQDVTQTSPEDPLRFSLNCACQESVFLQDSNLLVIDFLDTQIIRSAQEKIVEIPQYRFDQQLVRTREIGDRRRATVLPLVESAGEDRAAPEERRIQGLQIQPASSITPSAEMSIDIERSTFETHLSKSIQFSIQKGLLAAAQTNGATNRMLIDDSIRTDRNSPNENISVSTAADRDLDELATQLNLKMNGNGRCLSSRDVALSDWAGGSNFSDSIGKLRQELTSGIEGIQVSKSIALAQGYLHFGFGAEARKVLEIENSSSLEMKILNALATLIDVGPRLENSPFQGQHSCNSDVALWALYADPDDVENSNVKAVAKAVSRLPLHLREHIAPTVSQIFIDQGNIEIAEFILRSISRAVRDPKPSFDVSKAGTEEAKGNIENAEEARISVAVNSSEFSPRTIVSLIQGRYEADGAITTDIVDLIGSFAEQYQRSENGPSLRAAEVTALALAGDFEQSHMRLTLSRGTDDPAIVAESGGRFFELLTQRSEDIEFLKYALLELNELQEPLSDPLVASIARRFLDLGFSQPAIRLLSTAREGDINPDIRLLRAEAALLEGLPHEANIYLLGVEGEDADSLRAQSMLQIGNFGDAADILVDTQNTTRLARAQWLADEWDAASNTDTGYAKVAELSDQILTSPLGLETGVTLANAKRLLNASLAARQEIESLLDQVGNLVDQ